MVSSDSVDITTPYPKHILSSLTYQQLSISLFGPNAYDPLSSILSSTSGNQMGLLETCITTFSPVTLLWLDLSLLE